MGYGGGTTPHTAPRPPTVRARTRARPTKPHTAPPQTPLTRTRGDIQVAPPTAPRPHTARTSRTRQYSPHTGRYKGDAAHGAPTAHGPISHTRQQIYRMIRITKTPHTTPCPLTVHSAKRNAIIQGTPYQPHRTRWRLTRTQRTRNCRCLADARPTRFLSTVSDPRVTLPQPHTLLLACRRTRRSFLQPSFPDLFIDVPRNLL